MLANVAWLECLREGLRGNIVEVRGSRTVEQLGGSIIVQMRHPIVLIPERKLSYKFMAGEAYWILSGSNALGDMDATTRKCWEPFTDDGLTLHGAYGPKIYRQVDYVRGALNRDTSSRQAVINIWRENPPQTKDYPCTLSMQFLIRNTITGVPRLNTIVSMRSWDLWWGFPYDIFTFTMVSTWLALMMRPKIKNIELGRLKVTAGSMHLYEKHWDAAKLVVSEYLDKQGLKAYEQHGEYSPLSLSIFDSPDDLLDTLNTLRGIQEGALKLITP